MVEIERFWGRRGGSYSTDERGYLSVGGIRGVDDDPSVLTTGDLLDGRCVVIVGEPGSGKSTAIASLGAATRVRVADDPSVVMAEVDLATYGDETRLMDEVLRSECIAGWKSGSGDLYLFLDSLDECRLEIRKIATILASELREWPVERLWLRVVCRTADWPATLDAALKSLYDIPLVVELLPLRREDVVQFANEHGIDGSAFTQAVEAVHAVSLATRPLTLAWLVRTYSAGAGLPDAPLDLYRQATELLADEQNLARRDAGHTGELTANQRIAVAARIAAFMLLGGKVSLDIGPAGAPTASGVLRASTCVGGAEPANGERVEVTQGALEETVRTGLFTAGRAQALGFAHQTLTEFLTATYLHAHIPGDLRLRELLTSGVTGRARLFPHLRNVAAWLVALDSERYASFAHLDPAAFVAARIPLGNATVTAQIISDLFALVDSGDYVDEWGSHYGHLRYPGLSDQIRQVLHDLDLSFEARSLAITIAGEAGREGLAADLLAIVVNDDDDIALRVRAGLALTDVPEDSDSAPLRRLALNPPEADQNDELKGLVLHLLWPASIGVDDLLLALTRPKKTRFYGAYRHFINGQLPMTLDPRMLPAFLDWLLDVQDAGRQPWYEGLADGIVRLAWENLHVPGVTAGLARVALRRGAQNEPLFRGLGFQNPLPLDPDPERQRQLADAMLEEVDDDPHLAWNILDCLLGRNGPSLVGPDDLQWLINRHHDPTKPARPQMLERLIAWNFNPDHAGHAELVLNLPHDHLLRKGAFADWLAPIDVHSDKAAELRRQWQRRYRQLDDAEDNLPTVAELEARIREHLTAFDAGDTSDFWRAQYQLAIDPSRGTVNEHETDLTALPLWPRLPDDLHDWLLTAAPRYLHQADCAPEQWLGKNVHYWPAIAGYRALVLLYRLDRDTLDALPANIWSEWAPAIVAQPAGAADRHKEYLLTRAGHHAAESVLAAAKALLDDASPTAQVSFRTRELDPVWSDQLATLLFEHTRRTDLGDETWQQLTGELVRHQYLPALDDLEVLLQPEGRAAEPQRALTAAILLFTFAIPDRWPTISNLLSEDPDFGESLMLAIAGRNSHEEVQLNLDLESQTELAVWLIERFPPNEDPDQSGRVSPRQAVAWWRDRIVASIRSAGTREALAAIRRIGRAFPQYRWTYILAEAEETTLVGAWQPLDTETIRRLAENHETRLVRDAAHLYELVLEALDEIGSRLQDETPEARVLWDEVVMRPKNENAFADFVRNRLDEILRGRAIIINREVQVRHVQPTGMGESVDLQVDASANIDGTLETVSVVIEAKGCWNQDLLTDVETQLWQRYQRDVNTRYGVYLIAWFDTDSWANEDWRRTATQRRDRDEITRQLQQTAERIATEGGVVAVKILDASWLRPPHTAWLPT